MGVSFASLPAPTSAIKVTPSAIGSVQIINSDNQFNNEIFVHQNTFNTSVSAFMICVNELNDLKCNKKEILEQLLILIAPFAPHIAEELWHLSGNKDSITSATFPEFNEDYLVENTFEYPVSFNGKMRFKLELPLNMNKVEMEKVLLESENTVKWMEGKPARKIIIVPGRIINIVI